jgi:hypothetical protein
VEIVNVREQIAGTRMKCPPVFGQLHATRRPVQKPDTDIFFQLPDRRGGSALLYAQTIGREGEAPHVRDRDENEEGFEILHFVPRHCSPQREQ